MEGTIIRQVRPGDLEGAHGVERLSYVPEEAASRERFRKRIEVFPEGFLVAEVGGKIVGVINSACVEEEDITDEELKEMIGHVPGGRNIVIFTLVVLPEFRGQGISRLLMEKFLEVSRRLDKEKVLLICKEGYVDYYRKFGFEHIGLSKSTYGGAEWHEMHLPLTVD